ncbi:MAG: ThuA domain-containing protein [Pirellulaceae bacterium]
MQITKFPQLVLLITCSLLLMAGGLLAEDAKLKALIVDGQNNHGVWPKTTQMMKGFLEETGRFTVDVATTPPQGESLAGYRPKFAEYDVVVSNYNGDRWPKETEQDFVEYVKGGGGFVVVHAANNAFGDWDEYNQIIGLGGWGGRNEKSGPYVYFDEQGELVRDKTPGRGGNHGPQHPFQIVVRDAEHPITKGMPKAWMHTQDELYDLLRGPGENMKVLATAYADSAKGGTGRHEPMLMTISYGNGRVFHTPMGHAEYSMECVGFISSLQRGTEWAATGKVTIAIPDDFPEANEESARPGS